MDYKHVYFLLGNVPFQCSSLSYSSSREFMSPRLKSSLDYPIILKSMVKKQTFSDLRKATGNSKTVK